MPSKKMLIFLSIIIFIVLVLIIVFFAYDKDNEKNDFQSLSNNVAPVYNQGGEIVEYNNNIFFINSKTNSIIKYDMITEKSINLYKPISENIGDRLYIVGNKLIFTVGNVTNYIDLSNEDYVSKRFINGRIVYIDDQFYLAIYQNSLIQVLNVNSYNVESMSSDNIINNEIANGYKINYLKKIDDKLFFSSLNSDNSSTLFWVSIKESKSGIIAREYSINEENVDARVEIVDIAKKDHVYYYKANYYEKLPSVNQDFLTDSIVYNINEGEKYPERGYRTVNSYFVNRDDDIFYEAMDIHDLTYKWFDLAGERHEISELIYDIYGDVTNYVSYTSGDTVLYLNNIQVLDFGTEYENYSLDKVLHYNDKYYAFLVNGNAGVCFYFDKDGKISKKIYEWR